MEITASERVHGKFQIANVDFRGLGCLREGYTFPRTPGRGNPHFSEERGSNQCPGVGPRAAEPTP